MTRLRIQLGIPGPGTPPQALQHPDTEVVSCEGRLCAIVEGRRIWLEPPPREAMEDLHGE